MVGQRFGLRLGLPSWIEEQIEDNCGVIARVTSPMLEVGIFIGDSMSIGEADLCHYCGQGLWHTYCKYCGNNVCASCAGPAKMLARKECFREHPEELQNDIDDGKCTLVSAV